MEVTMELKIKIIRIRYTINVKNWNTADDFKVNISYKRSKRTRDSETFGATANKVCVYVCVCASLIVYVWASLSE